MSWSRKKRASTNSRGRGVLQEIERNPLLWMHDRDDELKASEGFLAHEDGVAFIDLSAGSFGEVENYNWVLEQHDKLTKALVREYANNESIRSKYEWLRAYHDRTMLR